MIENIKTEENLINESKKALVDFVEDTSLQEQTYTITTDYAKVIFTNKGGDIVSYELLQHKDGNNFIQMADSITDKNRAFSIALGDNYNEIINSIFLTKKIIGMLKKIKGTIIKSLTQGSNESDKNITIKQIETGKEKEKIEISNKLK